MLHEPFDPTRIQFWLLTGSTLQIIKEKEQNETYATTNGAIGAIASFQWNDFIQMICILLYTFMKFDSINSFAFYVNWIEFLCILFTTTIRIKKERKSSTLMNGLWWVQNENSHHSHSCSFFSSILHSVYHFLLLCVTHFCRFCRFWCSCCCCCCQLHLRHAQAFYYFTALT